MVLELRHVDVIDVLLDFVDYDLILFSLYVENYQLVQNKIAVLVFHELAHSIVLDYLLQGAVLEVLANY